MNETWALTRLCWRRSSAITVPALGYFVMLHALAWIVGRTLGDHVQIHRDVPIWIGFASLPLIALTLALFDLGSQSELTDRSSAYCSWLMRSPLPAWKLAAVPIALKTLWVLAVVGGFSFTAWQLGRPVQHWILSSVILASLFIFICVYAWRPFRGTYTRLILMLIFILPALGWLGLSATVLFDAENPLERFPPLRNFVNLVFPFVVVGVYALSVFLAIRAVQLARCNAGGMPGESVIDAWLNRDHTRAGGTLTTADSQRGTSAISDRWKIGPAAALVRYDLSKLTGAGTRLMAAYWLAVVLGFGLLGPVDLVRMLWSGLALLFATNLLVESLMYSRDRCFLPNLLRVSPLPTSTIVWTRQAVASLIWLVSLLGVPVVLALGWATGRAEVVSDWNRALQTQFGDADAGRGIAVICFFLVLILVVRQTTWTVAAMSTDNLRYLLYSVVGKFAVAFVGFSWFLFHFMQYPSWDAWAQWSWETIARIPRFLPWLLGIKLMIVGVATHRLIASGLTRTSTVAWILITLVALTLAIGAVSWTQFPSERVLLWHCIAVTAILMPASRILAAPICLAGNRHRGAIERLFGRRPGTAM
ncbi:hypothetical protein FYK55_05800 [Roseiconus nitratireducens]|uniref:Uncharacterized protein n=1 Tax=Roseiconus nitratireducens TaxID=2605748 RepID=A0A5M6DFK0_9BACT|nr:hypothetical protein [Roseiconus nitratireducens]KAA5545186.1 hypothetical protein FYK55_05800 [Roseiconus nitratireducens]